MPAAPCAARVAGCPASATAAGQSAAPRAGHRRHGHLPPARPHLDHVGRHQRGRAHLARRRGGFDPDRVHLKYNGVARPVASSSGPEAGMEFFFVGKLAEYKGVDLLLDAWRRVRHPHASLGIVGDGPMADHRAAAAGAGPWCG